MSRKIRGKEYVGCLIQMLQIVTGIIAIVVFIRQCKGGWKTMLLVAGIVLLVSGIVGMILQIQNIREKSE